VTTAPMSLEGQGGMLTVFTDKVVEDRLQLAAQFDHITVAIGLTRDDVRHLVDALDGWLFDSRPGA
jgi:hypothetical protein